MVEFIKIIQSLKSLMTVHFDFLYHWMDEKITEYFPRKNTWPQKKELCRGKNKRVKHKDFNNQLNLCFNSRNTFNKTKKNINLKSTSLLMVGLVTKHHIQLAPNWDKLQIERALKVFWY